MIAAAKLAISPDLPLRITVFYPKHKKECWRENQNIDTYDCLLESWLCRMASCNSSNNYPVATRDRGPCAESRTDSGRRREADDAPRQYTPDGTQTV